MSCRNVYFFRCDNDCNEVELKQLDSAMTDEQLEEEINRMTKENQEMEDRLKVLETYLLHLIDFYEMLWNRAETIDPKELESLRSEVSKYEKLWRKRRSLCKEKLAEMADNLDMKVAELNV